MNIFIGILIYLVGAVIWYFVERKWFPYQEGEYTIDFDGAHELTIPMQRDNRLCRVLLWPLPLAAFVILSPIALIARIFEKFEL